jgi:hypothetical protein
VLGSHFPPVIGERIRDAFRSLLPRAQETASPSIDPAAVCTAIAKYAKAIGCTDSNARAAQSYGLRWGGNTLTCIRVGKLRAEKLRHQQPDTPLDAA